MKILAFTAFRFIFLLFFLQSFKRTAGLEKEKLAVENSCPFHPSPLDLNQKDLDALSASFDAVSSYIESQVDEEIRPGISANIVYNNKIIWEGNFGQISKTKTTKPSGDTIFRIASISKVFPTIFLFKLWEDGKVNLSDPVTKYAPNFAVRNPFHFNDQLTLLDLASQINGLPSFFPYDLLRGDYFAYNGTLEQALEKLRIEQNLVIEPRTTCYYSNNAYSLLAYVLSRNFTEDGVFENWAQRNVVDVLNLSNTGFILTDEIKEKIATGYYATGQVAPLVDANWLRPAGNYYSSARDLAKLSMSLMGTSDQGLLKRETLVQMLTPVQKCGYGYLSEYTGSPWEINEQLTYLVIRKDGDIDGYSSTIAMIPKLKFSVTLLMNGQRPSSRSAANTVIETVLPTLTEILRKKEQPVVPVQNPSPYIGVYGIDNIQTWNVTIAAGNALVMTNPQDPGTKFKTVGLSFMSEGIFRLTILGGSFPCIIGTSNLDVQNGQIVSFSNSTDGRYNQFVMPGLNFFGFKRQS